MKNYSQARALWGILRSSLIATRRNISALVFGLIFPLVFIVIFGYLGQNGGRITLAVDPASNTNNPVYTTLTQQSNITIKPYTSADDIQSQLQKGQIDGLINIVNDSAIQRRPHYTVNLATSAAAPQQGAVLKAFVSSFADKANLKVVGGEGRFISISNSEVSGRKFSQIDFILPGMIGFSLLNAGIFATAFAFLTLRQTLVIKRFFTTPVSRFSIVFGESLSRLVVALFQAAIIICVGYFGFHFTLIHGFTTLLEMLALSAVGLTIFLGFGFVISSLADDERTIAPLAQLVTLPQFLLAGTFFPIDLLPNWLQKIANVLPLTYLNDAMRKVAFEGAGLSAISHDLLWLLVWGVVIYLVTIRVFRWEV